MHSRHDVEETGSELYGKVAPWVVIVLVLLGGWLFREPLTARFAFPLDKGRPGSLPALGTLPSLPSPAASSASPATGPATAAPEPRKDTVYRWVDSNGVTHYDQQASSGREAVEVDQGRINSLNNYPAPAPAPAPGK